MATVDSHSLGRLHDSRGPALGRHPSPHFLLVMTVDSLAIEPLPVVGQLIIGRSKTADLRLGDAAVSPRHLRLSVGERLTVEDLGSLSGTRIGGTAIAARTPIEILPGEPVSLGGTVLMVREMTTSERPQRIWSHGVFQQRVHEECERGIRGGAGFALVRVLVSAQKLHDKVRERTAERIWGALAATAPSPHAVGVYGADEYELLLVGMTAAQAAGRVAALQKALAEDGLVAATGLASFPEDGRSTAVLLERANDRLFATTEPALWFSPADQSLIAAASRHDQPLLLTGESGSGKETLARAIHGQSRLAPGPFCVVEAAGRSAAELEAILFGDKTQPGDGIHGAWSAAAGGTLFVADADWLPTAALLRMGRPDDPQSAPRLIVTRTVETPPGLGNPINGLAGQTTDRRRQLRRDPGLLLAAEEVVVAPLRARSSQLLPVIDCLMANAARARGRGPTAMATEGRAWLERRPWPGNIRELKNVIDRSVAVARLDPAAPHRDDDVGAAASPGQDLQDPKAPLDLRGAVAEVLMQTADLHAGSLGGERDRIVAALTACAFNQSRAASRLGISRRTLVARLGQFGIDRPLKSGS